MEKIVFLKKDSSFFLSCPRCFHTAWKSGGGEKPGGESSPPDSDLEKLDYQQLATAQQLRNAAQFLLRRLPPHYPRFAQGKASKLTKRKRGCRCETTLGFCGQLKPRIFRP